MPTDTSIETYSTVEQGQDGAWWWEAAVVGPHGDAHAGPACGYPTREAAEAAMYAWMREQVS